MAVLVTGANGFVGRHVVAEFADAGYDVLATDHASRPLDPAWTYCSVDVTDESEIDRLIGERPPDACVHLAGLAAPAGADKDPAAAFAINTVAVIRLLEGMRRHAPAAPVLIITSALVYGHQNEASPLTEDAPLRPASVYAVTKAAADQTTLLLAEQGGLPWMTARPTNHIGPGQSPKFVVPALAGQCAAIRRGAQAPRLRVGNLESRRDFLDVRDVARAYRSLLEQGRPGTAYNIAGGQLSPIRQILESLCRICGIDPSIEVDPARYRPTETAVVLDASRLRQHTGWHPQIDLERSLADVVADCERFRQG